MINSSFTETPSGLAPKKGSKEEAVASGSVSTISGHFEYESFINSKLSVVSKIAFPLMPSSTGTYVFAGGAMNYYFTPISSTGIFRNEESKIMIIPKFRYYAGGGLAGAYLIYNTLTAKKTDTQVELFGQAGAIYNTNDRWGYRAELGMARGVGFNTSSTTLKISFGVSYSLN